MKGLLSRVSGADGFQLVNVTDAPVQLEQIEFENRLVNRVSTNVEQPVEIIHF